MDNLCKVIGILCITGYVMGILMNFSTANYTAKSIRLVTALYLITAVFNSENRFNFDFKSVIIPTQRQVYQDNTEYVISLARVNIEEKIKEILNEKNISYEKVKVHIHKQTEKLYIHSVEILGSEYNTREYIIEILKDTIPREIIIWGD